LSEQYQLPRYWFGYSVDDIDYPSINWNNYIFDYNYLTYRYRGGNTETLNFKHNGVWIVWELDYNINEHVSSQWIYYQDCGLEYDNHNNLQIRKYKKWTMYIIDCREHQHIDLFLVSWTCKILYHNGFRVIDEYWTNSNYFNLEENGIDFIE